MTDPYGQQAATPAGTDPSVPAGGFLATAKASALLVLLLLAFLGLRYTEAGTYLSKERIQLWISGFGLLAPAVHVLVFAVGTTALVPATVFTLMGAVVFGKFLGSIYNLAGAIGGAVLSFLTARYLGRDFAARWMQGRLRALDAKAEQHGFILISYLRLAYVPFAPLNYTAGLTRIRFPDYLFGTILGILPGMFIITSLVDEVTNLRSPADLLATRFLAPLLLFVASFFLPIMIKRLAPALHSTPPPREGPESTVA
ncbi:MAG: TVP38/TMEM64 family protein [candidate division NC10 bacterium]|nr:TVP38/TMEM64 family protein [candidate division NC10 bacterium]MBI2563280.1 TVP38/TMEM64 family protein [candidate division NC10 bacterium]MBI3122063.1 TVP38/TMEM64 family protein [candidate division NC10 bacterium]